MDEIVTFYSTSLRGSLFSGFLTLTGFLFSMKAFLLANLNRDIYGTADYQKWVEKARQYNAKLQVTSQMRNLSRLLLVTLISTFTTSILQLTLGLVPSVYAVAICLISTCVAVVCTARCIWVLSDVVKDWMDFIDDQSATRVAADQQPKAPS